jgi:hypothetical protein
VVDVPRAPDRGELAEAAREIFLRERSCCA